MWDGGPSQEPVVRSSLVIQDNLDPTWDSDGRFIFPVTDGWKMSMQVKVFDEVWVCVEEGL